MTREHFISKTILNQLPYRTLKFENAGHFFGGKSNIDIGIEAFSTKVLCENHNSALSVLDTAAGLAFAGAEALARDLIANSNPNKSNTITSFYLSSGMDIERWMIKVFCALASAGKIRSISGKIRKDIITNELLNALVGNSILDSPLGLYMHAFVGQQRRATSFTFGTIQSTDGSDEVRGLSLGLGLLNFVLITLREMRPSSIDPNWYRHQGLAFNIHQNGSRIGYLLTY